MVSKLQACAQQTFDRVAVEVIEMLRISFPVSASLLLSAEHERTRFAPRAEAGEKSEHQFSAILVGGDFGICGVVGVGGVIVGLLVWGC